MSIVVEFDATNNILRGTLEGRMTGAILLEFYAAATKYMASHPPCRGILDFSEVTEFEVSSDAIRHVAAAPPAFPTGYTRVLGQYPLIIKIVIGDVVGLWIGRHQLGALLKIHSNHQRIAILMQAREQRAAHLEPRCAIGRGFFHVIERQRHLARSFESHRHTHGRLACPLRPSKYSVRNQP